MTPLKTEHIGAAFLALSFFLLAGSIKVARLPSSSFRKGWAIGGFTASAYLFFSGLFLLVAS
jgi:hypothetical protein